MRRTNPRTETLTCDGLPSGLAEGPKETAFEKQRGISHLETRQGYCQVHVTDLEKPLSNSRLAVLRALAESDISIDFLKLTPDGFSFVAPEGTSSRLEAALVALGVRHSVRRDRSIVWVHAVNMRDEEGLIAEVVQSAIASGAQIDHIGDGHDHLLLVVAEEHAHQVQAYIRRLLIQNPKREGRTKRTA